MTLLRGVAAGLLPGLLALTAAVGADAPKTEEGFTPLFNGKDLTGWRYKGSKESLEGKTETPDGRIRVEGGAIVMREKDARGRGGIKDLYTLKNFPRPFHLKLQFRASLKADSGVYVRGPQLQVRDFIRRGEEKQLTKFKNDDWNELEIAVKGQTATCSVNGQPLQVMKVPDKGPIGLQAESGKFEFRRVRIKELP